MTAILIPTASEAEWFEARRQGITASEIAVVMGLSPYSSPYKLYHQKLGILGPDEDNAAMERGRVLEPYVAGKFAAAHPEFTVWGDGRELFAHQDRPWQMATPDREIYEVSGMRERLHRHEPLAVLETKTDSGSDEWGEPGTDEIPVHYRCQVLWQMDVMGVHKAYVACLRIRDWRVLEYVIEHDPSAPLGYDVTHAQPICDLCSDILTMRVAAAEFLERLDLKDEPDVDWRPATIDALKQLHPSVDDDEDALVSTQLAKRYRAAVKNAKHWEQRKKLYEAQLREAMGSARRASFLRIGREPLVRRDVYEVREHVRKAATVDKLVPVYPKESKTS